MRSRKFLAFILLLISGPALAGYMTLLGAGTAILTPTNQVDYTSSPAIPGWQTFTRADASTIAKYYNSSGTLTTVASATDPRFDYDPATLSFNGLLAESSFIDLVLQTNFAATWTATRATLAAGAATGIDGTASAATLIEDSTATNSHFTQQTITTASGSSYTYNVVAKANGRDWLALRLPTAQFTNPLTAYFNLQTGVVGSVTSPATSSIQSLGNGWYRCIITATSTTAASAAWLIMLANADGGVTYSGNGTSGAYLGFPQGGIATVPQSIVSATTTSVTRAADSLTEGSAAQIWQRKSISTGTVDRIYYASGAAPNPLPTGYWYQSTATYPRDLSVAEQTPRLVVGAPY